MLPSHTTSPTDPIRTPLWTVFGHSRVARVACLACIVPCVVVAGDGVLPGVACAMVRQEEKFEEAAEVKKEMEALQLKRDSAALFDTVSALPPLLSPPPPTPRFFPTAPPLVPARVTCMPHPQSAKPSGAQQAIDARGGVRMAHMRTTAGERHRAADSARGPAPRRVGAPHRCPPAPSPFHAT